MTNGDVTGLNTDQVREQVRSGALTADAALARVEQALRSSSSAALWILRGDLIQLSESPSHDLSDAANSYREAHKLEPDNPEPLEELGHFFDAVMADRAQAKWYYRAAIAKGAGEECERYLNDLLREEEEQGDSV